MWLKNIDEISKYIPNDNKWKDVQILNSALYVDGELVNLSKGTVTDFKVLNYALTDEEIAEYYFDGSDPIAHDSSGNENDANLIMADKYLVTELDSDTFETFETLKEAASYADSFTQGFKIYGPVSLEDLAKIKTQIKRGEG